MIITEGNLDFTIKKKVREALFDWMLDYSEEDRETFETALNDGLRSKVSTEIYNYYCSLGRVAVILDDDELFALYKSYV